MILDSYKLNSVVFQIQYKDAFELWDRAGNITRGLTRIWPDLKLIDAQPQQQIVRAKGVQIHTGLTQATVTLMGANSLDSHSVQKLKSAFDVWREFLELTNVNRISTRAVYMKEFASQKEANAELIGLGIARWPQSKVFDQPMDSEKNGVEIHYRFEDKESFALLRFRAEEIEYKVELDPQFVAEADIRKSKRRMVIDFDRGLLGEVSAEKFRVEDWIKGFVHVLRRDIEKITKVEK